jgi:aspartyl-tRNA(Asn)/glutamyl-tRNA(Gln) amidotransferase subunit C
VSGLIDAEQVRHIAQLARLSLTEGELERFSEQLGEILDHFERLQAVDTAGVEPLSHPHAVVDALRADEPGACLGAERALASAPEQADGLFKVPRVLGGGA